MQSITLVLPYPCSMNQLWRVYKGRQVQSPAATKYKNEVKYIASQRKLPVIFDDVSITIEFRPKLTKAGVASKICLDLDNCIKATLDAIQGVIINDDKQVKRLYAYYGEPVLDGGLVITVEQNE